MSIKVKFPPLFFINDKVNDNNIYQIIQPSYEIEADVANYSAPPIKGKIIIPKEENQARILLVENKKSATNNHRNVILVKDSQFEEIGDNLDLSNNSWLSHSQLEDFDKNYDKLINDIQESWKNGFQFIKEDLEDGIKGLRDPQMGAIHAIHSHWCVSNETATIVMPTGTGKTETMLSILVSMRCKKILVVVPTDALRTQISDKFINLGILKEFGIVSSDCLFPVVGLLNHKPKSTNEVDEFFSKCNVVITTSSIAGQSPEEIQERVAEHCSELFIDEAHHVSAPTWKKFKDKFKDKRILQFTATPFREDDKPVEGKIIFKYPLQKAQEQGYFTKIDFKPVKVFSREKHDKAIAELAVEQLRIDLLNYPHILMARVNSIPRAKEVFAVYEEYEEFNPVQIHNEISKTEREKIKESIKSGKSKIIVCVDMLGEGFDLPELKIAAFHDIRKSPTITIQLAGRFTRSRDDLGEATFIANIGREEHWNKLKKLYTQDPDWNYLLPQLVEELIKEQVDLNDYAEGFDNFPKEIPIQTLRPALSTVIYKTKCEDWTPENFEKGLTGYDSFEKVIPDINRDRDTLIIVTAEKHPVEWTQIEDIFYWVWNLYVVYWNKEQNLLYINNSTNKGKFKNLAKAVAGENVELVEGENLFRCLGKINRLTFKNVGLSEQLGRLVSYTGRMGSDVAEVITEIHKQRASKSVLFGSGFENGEKTTIGCSVKGRLWSHGRSYHLNTLVNWFSHIGTKILDDSIDPNDFLKNTLVSTYLKKRPAIMPFGIDWNESIYKYLDDSVTFIFDDELERQLFEVDIKLTNHSENEEEDIEFVIESEDIQRQFSLTIFEEGGIGDFLVVNNNEVPFQIKWRGKTFSAESFFDKYPPSIWFVDGSKLNGNKFVKSMKSLELYDKEKISVWDWEAKGVDIKKESQRTEKITDSIQFGVIQELKKNDFDLIFDDDASGEAADIVTVMVKEIVEDEKIIEIEFYHCKYSSEEKAGARIGDLVEVCSQAQKNFHWIENISNLFIHLLSREEKRFDETGVSRIEKGDADKIYELMEMSRVYRSKLKVYIVQPGLSKDKISENQLRLLGVTENFLKETYLIPLEVIGSA